MAPANQLDQMQQIVVLMLENRSFDHMLGFLYEGKQTPAGVPFEGLTGTESNIDSTGKAISVWKITPATPDAYLKPGHDPGEGYQATNLQLFGADVPPTPPVATNSGFVTDFEYVLKTQTNRPTVPGTTPADIMAMHTPETLPVLSALAAGYAVSDMWFAPAPTETLPNRAFACAATSLGHMDDSTKYYNCQSIFGLLSQHNLDWRIFGYSGPPLTRNDFPDVTQAPAAHFGVFQDFQTAAAAGTLPPFTFLEPSWGSTGNSQHPTDDVALGEQLIHDVYYALYNGKGWATTLLIITYDEHGGCYDHVPPPLGATTPDASVGEFGFDFTRFGVRVPAVLVSPLIPAGTVLRAPEGMPPFDHTSILATVEHRWNLPPLTGRDKVAADVGGALTAPALRTDDPLHGVTPPSSRASNPAGDAPSHLQQIQAEQVASLIVPGEHRPTRDELAGLHTGADYERFVAERTARWQKAQG